MDGEKETVSVKWWNHRSALCRAIRDIYMKNLYADVKLVCEGQEHWVHKFVLSACSEYFEEILVDVPYRGSVTLSPLVQQKELLSLLDFMYLGIVDVLHEELPALVGAAEILMIRGLAIPYEEEDSDQENPNKTKENEVSSKNLENLKKAETKTKLKAEITAKRKRSEDTGSGELLEVTKEEEYEDFPELDRVPKLEPSTSGEPLLERSPDQNCQVTSSNAEVNAMLKVLIGERPRRVRKKLANVINDDPEKAEVGRKEPEGLTCSQCNKTFQWRSNLTKHMRTHTGEKPYSCSICSYKTSYSEALKRHMRIHTGEKPYQCNYCDYKSRDHGSLKVHLKRHCSSESISASRNNPQDSDDSNLVINESFSISDFATQNSQQKSDMIFENTNT